MASRKFADALARTSQTKDLDKIVNGNTYLNEGEHEVTIQAVDLQFIEQDQLIVTMATAAGQTHNERVFLVDNKDGGLGYGFRLLLGAVLPNKEMLGQLLEAAGADEKVFEIFTGMKVQVTLKRGKGYIVKSVGGQSFAAFDSTTGEKITEDFEEVKEAQAQAEAGGMKRAYLNAKSYKSIDAEGNKRAFEAAMASRAAQPKAKVPAYKNI